MKRIKCIALVSALVLAAGGCSDDPELYITLPESQSKVMNIDAKTQSITVNVEHNVDMEVTISEEATWLTQGGTTENTYTFNAAENDDTAERKATITFANTANGLSQTVEVTQAGAEPAIVISNPKVELAADSTFTVEVKHNVEVEVAISEEASEWLTQVEAETRAMTTNTYTFNAAENPDTTARKATITFTDTSSNLCDTVEVTQAGRELEDISKNISDAKFRKYCLDNFDENKDGKLTPEEAANVTTINVLNKKYTSLEGIEYFTELTYLNCQNNKLTSLDVSKNTKLTNLNCIKNKVAKLDVTLNTELDTLDCGNNELAELDVSQNTKLKKLNCIGNNLTNLDVKSNVHLLYLQCGYNQLENIDVSYNTALTRLDCSVNQLTSLDLSKNTALTSLSCYSNQLTSLDVSKNTALTNLTCYFNQLTSLDLSNNTELTELMCIDNQLTSLDVSKNTELTELLCYSNQLTSLDVSKNTKLITLHCYDNQLTSLDVSKNTELTELFCYSNQLTNLDVTNNTNLTSLRCYENQLTNLDVSKTKLNNYRTNTLDCAPMDDESGKNLLDTLTLKKGWSIKGVTEDSRSEEYIPKETQIIYVEVE